LVNGDVFQYLDRDSLVIEANLEQSKWKGSDARQSGRVKYQKIIYVHFNYKKYNIYSKFIQLKEVIFIIFGKLFYIVLIFFYNLI